MNVDTKTFGFWVYLMTDLIIFAVLFATFIVLRNNTFGGPSGGELFSMPYALAETLILLTSTFTCSLGMLFVHRNRKISSLFWFLITFILGISFLVFEIVEFADFVKNSAIWTRSGFLSSFFTLVGTHGFHITIGLLWMLVEMFRILLRSISPDNISRIFRMTLFWHFLDVVWIFIFTVVYGIGHIG